MPRWFSLLILLAVVLASFLASILAAVFLAGSAPAMPALSESALQAAEARWRDRGPRNYDVEVEISDGQRGKFHVEVRDGVPTAVTRNGIAPRRHTWETWTIDGQFDTLERELEGAADPHKVYGVPEGSQVQQHALFDPELGYPRRYERHVLGAQLPVAWEVTRFTPVEPSPESSP